MYIAYQYKAAVPPDPYNSDALTITRVKNLIVQDLSTILTSITSKYDLSDACLNVNYSGNEVGWSKDMDKEDINYEYHIKSNNAEEYYKKFISISTLEDTSTDSYGFTKVVNTDGTVAYTDDVNLITFNMLLKMYDDTGTLCPQSKTKPLKLYANGGTIHIHVNKNHLMMSSINTTNDKYSSPIGIADIDSKDMIIESFPRFVFFTCYDWDLIAVAPSPLYCTRKPSTTTYGTYSGTGTDNTYSVEIYDKVGIINFYNPDSVSHKFYYGNHVYANDKNSTNYIFGGSLSELGKFYCLPKTTIAAKVYDEIAYGNNTYIIWPIRNDDFTSSNMRLLLLKG